MRQLVAKKELVAVVLPGRLWLAGALMLPGGSWPAHSPVWICPHRHADSERAISCAIAERQRRDMEVASRRGPTLNPEVSRGVKGFLASLDY